MLIGLTGGIGSGKSTAAALFTELGVPVIKADHIVSNLIQPNSQIYKEIINYFGKSILNNSLEINKAKLRQIIFSNQKNKLWLENLIHPLVYQELINQIATIDHKYCILEIPLLIEKPPPFHIDRILVIDCPKELQIIRTIKRDKITREEVENIILMQINRKTRLKQCQDIIVNEGSIEVLEQQLIVLHKKYLKF